MELSCHKVTIPQILMVILFLCAIYGSYSDLLEQFWTRIKLIEMATIDLVVEDIVYHDSFIVHECKDVKLSRSTPCLPATTSANTD
jgi:hypothetical protein